MDPRKGKSMKSPAEGAPDGPARVVKPGDWGAVADGGMKGFTMNAFSVPGRALPKPDPAETRLADLEKKIRRAEEAHKEALRKAAKEADGRVAEAEKRGREEGRKEGEATAGEKYAKSIDELRNGIRGMLEALAREKASLFLSFEGEAVALAAAAVKRVFEGVADNHAEAVLPLLRQAVAALGEAASIIIRVNPADLKVLDENRSFWIPLESALKDMRIIQDSRIPKGSCLVEGDSTSIEMKASDLGERMGEALARVFEAKSRALGVGNGETASEGEDDLGAPQGPLAGAAS